MCGCINGGAAVKFGGNADVERAFVGFFGRFSFFGTEIQIVVNRFKKIEDAGGDVQTVLGGDLGGKHLIDAARGLVHHALHGRDDLDSLAECRGLFNHIDSDIKNDGCLLSIGCAGVDLCFPFIIIGQHVQRKRRTKLGLAVFLGDLNIGGIVLPLIWIIVAHRAKHVCDVFFLPRQQKKGLPVKFTLGVFQTFDKADDTFCLLFIEGYVTTRLSEWMLSGYEKSTQRLLSA